MLPELFKLGPFPIRLYGPMIAIGFLVSLYFIVRDGKKAGVDTKIYENGGLYTLVLGILGTRIAYIWMFPEGFSLNDPIAWFAVWRGGLVFQGGPPLVMLFFYFYLKRHGLGYLKTADHVFPYFPLAHAFGRLGCFFNGCCYGAPSDLPWALSFPRVPWDTAKPVVGSPVFQDHLYRFSEITTASHWSLPVHPTQLYSVTGLLTICAILLILRKHWHPFDGFTMAAYFLLYGIHRFIVEFFRGDHNPVHLGTLTDQQVLAILSTILGIALFLFMPKKSRTNPA